MLARFVGDGLAGEGACYPARGEGTMVDRLLSGAGAFAYLADRLVTAVLVRGRGGPTGPAGLLLAIALGIGAVIGFASAYDNSGDPTLRQFTAGELATGDPGDRTYATVEGGVAPGYIITYRDANKNGTRDPDETGNAWNYFLVDPTTRSGVTVESDRSPEDVFAYAPKGVVVEDAEYVAEDLTEFKSWLDETGVALDPSKYIDTRQTGSPTLIDLLQPLPADGTAVEIHGSRSSDFVSVCSTDTNGDGTCSGDEVDLWDVVAYDPRSKKGVTVLVGSSPEFAPATFTGMLRRSPSRVVEAARADNEDFKLSDLRLTISTDYLLDDGARPIDPLTPLAFGIAAALLAVVIVIGTVGGAVRFRPDPPGLRGVPAAAMTAGERVPVHVTGALRSANGYVRSREAPADFVRFVLEPVLEPTPTASAAATPAEPDGAAPPETSPSMSSLAPGGPAPTTLIVERRGRPQGVAIGRGELSGMQIGTAMLFRRPRPALRLRAGTGTLIVSFDEVAARDRAARELTVETGILGGP